MPHNLGHMVYDFGHNWGNSHDNERVICINCEASPLSSEAKEPCLVSPLKDEGAR